MAVSAKRDSTEVAATRWRRGTTAQGGLCLYGRFNAGGNLQPAIVKPGDAFIRAGFICLQRAPKPRGEKGLLSNKKDETELCMDRVSFAHKTESFG